VDLSFIQVFVIAPRFSLSHYRLGPCFKGAIMKQCKKKSHRLLPRNELMRVRPEFAAPTSVATAGAGQAAGLGRCTRPVNGKERRRKEERTGTLECVTSCSGGYFSLTPPNLSW
jgi:hypothetical protein